MHEQVQFKNFTVDKEILGVIKLLHALNIKTLFSCQGSAWDHPDAMQCFPMVICEREDNNHTLDRLVNWLTRTDYHQSIIGDINYSWNWVYRYTIYIQHKKIKEFEDLLKMFIQIDGKSHSLGERG